jgi:hypothetical protein
LSASSPLVLVLGRSPKLPLRRHTGTLDMRLLLSAHSETVGARAKMPVRKQRQVSTKAVTRPGYYRSTPIRVTPTCWPLCTNTGRE